MHQEWQMNEAICILDLLENGAVSCDDNGHNKLDSCHLLIPPAPQLVLHCPFALCVLYKSD